MSRSASFEHTSGFQGGFKEASRRASTTNIVDTNQLAKDGLSLKVDGGGGGATAGGSTVKKKAKRKLRRSGPRPRPPGRAPPGGKSMRGGVLGAGVFGVRQRDGQRPNSTANSSESSRRPGSRRTPPEHDSNFNHLSSSHDVF